MKRLAAAASIAAALTLAGAAACGNPTAGVPITLAFAVEAAGDGTATTPSGWTVELEEARALIGPVYAYAPLDDARASWVLGPPVARAHGGFDPLDGRLVRAEVLAQHPVDALGGRAALGPIDGLAGAVDELSVVLDAPRGALADADGPTRGHHLWVRGVARRAGEEVRFEGGLDLPDEGASRRVDGIGVEGPALAEGATLVLAVDAGRWLAEADFEGLVGADAPVEITPESQPHRAWRLGARSAAAWAARVEGEAE